MAADEKSFKMSERNASSSIVQCSSLRKLSGILRWNMTIEGSIRCWLFVMALQLLVGIAPGQENQAESPTDAKTSAPAATIDDVKWITGHWQGSAMGGKFEETWNPPFAGSMVGMFKFAKNEQVEFYELLTIIEKDDSLLLRLKHFDKDLNGWEEKDKSVEFPLLSLTETEAKFDGLVFKKINPSTMHIVVTVSQKEGQSQKIKFVCKRSKDTE